MTEKEYFQKLDAALREAGHDNRRLRQEELKIVAHSLPIDILRAVANNEITEYNKKTEMHQTKLMHEKWVSACDEVLAERIITGNADEREKS